MRIHIEIKDPRTLKDTFGKPIKGTVRPLGTFESLEKAIDWLEFILVRQKLGGSLPEVE